MSILGLERDVQDGTLYDRAVRWFRDARIALPTFAELAEPFRIPERVRAALEDVDPDAAHPLNLFRVHWYNDASRRGMADLPEHVVLPSTLTGVDAPIIVLLGDRFPMIHAHKVLAAYACLAPRVVTGQFDPSRHRAVWPSTGNYCRGGVAISRIMGCRGIAVLPEGMSHERFRWLEAWVTDQADIIRTPGTESNVKEIYDRCAELALEPDMVVFNQFREFGNHLAHLICTGSAMERTFESVREAHPGLSLAAFVSASGSAGTLAAGDHLKERYGAKIVAAEALECPTLLENGFGSHNIQGIGDKHVPLIHNVMNTDVVVAISDRVTDELDVVFNDPVGRDHLAARGVPPATIAALGSFGLSSICNVVAAVKTAKTLRLGRDDAVVTVATDGAGMYVSERKKTTARRFASGFDDRAAAATFDEHMMGATTEHVLQLDERERRRIFNLGYFTWVEQQGVPLETFVARREPAFWTGLRETVTSWDRQIEEFNRRTGATR